MDDNYKFIEWLANNILDEEWDEKHDLYTELICRKLVNLGFLKRVDGFYKKNDE